MKNIPLLKSLIIILILFFTNTILFSQIDSGFVEIKKGVLFYRVWGEGPPMVFLNGGSGLASNGYEVYAEETSKHRKVILFDQRGTGKSKIKRKVDFITMRDMVDDIERLRKHLKIEKWDVFGHSFGGDYAMNYILAHPKNIDKVILSATLEAGSGFSRSIQNFLRPHPDDMMEIELEVYQRFLEEKAKEHPSPILLRKLSAAMKARFYVSKPEYYADVIDWWLYKSNPTDENYCIKINYDQDYKKRFVKKLKRFDHKVLIIHGINDFINISNPLKNHELFPNSQLKILTDAGHMMSIDCKEEYFNTINNFLTETL